MPLRGEVNTFQILKMPTICRDDCVASRQKVGSNEKPKKTPFALAGHQNQSNCPIWQKAYFTNFLYLHVHEEIY